MKIAFVGKGGSGKTTTTSLLVRTLAARSLPVLAVDADINQHLAESAGFTPDEARAIPPMGIEMNTLKDFFRGSNARIASANEMIKTTPPGMGSKLISVTESNTLYEHFAREKDGIRLMAVGPFTEEDIGIKCYHSKTGAVELLLNHLIDREREYAVVDMTAGADSFASGLFTRFDVTFVAVEPTLKSVQVFEQYQEHAAGYGLCIKAVGTKVRTDTDRAFLAEHLGDNLIACLTLSDYVRSQEQGSILPIAELEPENAAAIEELIRFIDAQPKDWNRFYAQALEFHLKNAQAWANEEYGMPLEEQIDPAFDMAAAARAVSG